MTTASPNPRGYPWAVRARSGVLRVTGFLDGPVREDVERRTPVVAVGSNAAPAVLTAKLGGLMGTGVPMTVATVEGLHVGHSAHVSAGGYVAAAPVRGCYRAVRAVTVCWFDEAQLERVDQTEPNYRRVPLPADMRCRTDAGAVTGAQIYTSVHGVLGQDGSVLALRDQAGVLSWLAARVPGDVRELLSHDRMVDPDVRERIRLALMEADLVLPSGW